MRKERIDKYWNNFFGLEDNELTKRGIIITPHNYLDGYNGVWIFQRENQIILSVESKMIDKLRSKIKEKQANETNLFSRSYIEYLFGKDVDRIIGPVYQGYYDDELRSWQISEKVKQINFMDHPDLADELSRTGDDDGWAHSGINSDIDGMYGFFHEGKLESISCYKMLRGDVGFVGIYTNPKFRGKGFSYEVAKRVVKELSERDKLIRYQTLKSNKASIKIANKLGFEEYGNNIAIRLKKKKD